MLCRESLNRPPEIVVSDLKTGKERLITDLNPQLEKFEFGRVEEIEWTDRMGRKWRGSLFYPPDYEAGKRYPLVIQTHGFKVRENFPF